MLRFLTTEPNDLVRPVHAKAIPLILRTDAEQEEWLTAPAAAIPHVQARLLPADALDILSGEEASQYGRRYLKRRPGEGDDAEPGGAKGAD